jgi:Protein of unknown function (DUF3262)
MIFMASIADIADAFEAGSGLTIRSLSTAFSTIGFIAIFLTTAWACLTHFSEIRGARMPMAVAAFRIIVAMLVALASFQFFTTSYTGSIT